MSNNLFEIASREKYRYPYKGFISSEQLWDLPLSSLDEIYKTLNKEQKKQDEDSLMSTPTGDCELSNKIEIVKYIFSVKKQEKENRKKEAEKAAKQQRILEILAQKQDAALMNLSEDELRKMLDET